MRDDVQTGLRDNDTESAKILIIGSQVALKIGIAPKWVSRNAPKSEKDLRSGFRKSFSLLNSGGGEQD